MIDPPMPVTDKALTERLDIDFALKAARLGVWELDPVTKLVKWDDRCRELFGLTQNRLLTYEEAIRFIHPDDASRVDEAVQQVLSPTSNGQYDVTYRTIGADDGVLRWVRFIGQGYFNEAGEIYRFSGVAQDVTKDVELQLHLKTNEQRFRSLLEEAAIATCLLTGPEMTIAVANDIMLQYWGKGRDVVGKTHSEVLPELKNQPFGSLLDNVYSTGNTYEAKAAAANLEVDGSLRTYYFDFSYKALRNTAGSVYGILVTAIDVTEQVLAQQQVEASQMRFELIAKATHDIVWDWNLETNEIWWNEGYQTLLGYRKEDMLPGVESWSNFIHPHDRERVVQSIHAIIDHGGENWADQYRFRKADGTYAYMLDRGYTIHRDGKPIRMVGSMVDLSKQKQVEDELIHQNEVLEDMVNQFKFVTDFMPQMVWATYPDGTHDFFNQQWYEFTGLTYNESKGQGWAKVLHPDDWNRTKQIWGHSLATGSLYQIEYRMRRHDGVYHWFLARALPLRNEQGAIVKWFGTCTDIDDQKTQAQTLEQMVNQRTAELTAANQDLQRSNSNLQQFAYVASHDLQEPLRKIQSFGDLLKNGYADQLGDGVRYLERMQVAAHRMSTLIKDLLMYSRISTRQDASKAVSLAQVLSITLADLELSIQETGAIVDMDPLPTVQGDDSQLGQLFLNLLSNALKFQRPGVPPVIRIQTHLVSAEDLPPSVTPARQVPTYHRIDIVDNGIGFEPKYLDRIFQVFQRLHNSSQFAGTGIGLAICEKVVANHGGAITAMSQPGQGATFSIYLPHS
ncbi:hypothetical protein GCM10027341_40280 [Spirosoma knui]